MSTNYLALRSSAAPSLTVSTLLGSTIAARSISLQSTTISLGQSTNQSYTNFSNGSFTTGWASTLTGLTSIKEVVLSPNGSVQTILQNSGSTMSTVITSANSGITWAGSTMRGLPTSGALPYQTYGSTINAMPVPSITAITAAPSGTNQLAIASNELVYASANSGATFAATGLGQNNSPFIYLPFDGSVTDVMGNSVVTATGSPAYVAGKVGTNALNLVNTAGIFSNTANNYVRYTVPSGMTSFTISGWFNSQTTVSTGYPTILTMYSLGFLLYLNPGTTIQLVLNYPTGSGNGQANIQTSCGIAMNTWYSFTIVYQIGTVSLYLNGALVGTGSSTGLGTFTGSTLGLGCYDSNTNQPFSGYIDDFRIYNYAVTNPSGAALINPLVGPIMPFVYLTFDGSTTTDVMGNSTVTATGSPTFVAGQVGSTAINFVNTAGGTATRYVRGTWTSPAIYTVTGWFNLQSYSSTGNQFIFSTGGATGANAVLVYVSTTNQLFAQIPNGTLISTGVTISLNTWYYFSLQMSPSGNVCSLHLNNSLYTATATATGAASGTYGIGTFDSGGTIGAFNGYIDDFRIYNGAFTPSQLSPVLYSPSHAVGSPNIYLPFENGSVLDIMGYSAVSARGTMNFVPGVVGTSALNLVNPVSGNPNNYVYASWAGSSSFTVSGWVNVQGFSGYSIIFSAYNRGIQIYTNYGTNTISAVVPSGSSTIYLSFNSSSSAVVNTWYSFTLIFQTNGLCSFYVNNQLAGSGTNSGGFGSFTNSGIICLGGYDTATASGSNAFSGYIDDVKIYNSAVPFHALGPMNYTQAAISNSGAYQVVAAANGGVYTSANSGSTWSQAVTSPAVASAVNTVGGQVITPNLASLAANTWTQNGVNWVASASTVYQNAAYFLFNTAADNWASALNTYNSTTGLYAGSVTTVTQNAGTISGEWFQIQSSVPVVATSYSYIPFNMACTAKTYFILGSNDGSTWYAIQSASYGATNPCTNGSTPTSAIIVNSSSVQTVTAGATGSLTTAAYSTTTNAYTYFRLVGTTTWTSSPAAFMQYGEFYFNFATPPTPLYVAPSTALIQSLNAITVMPQQTGLASSTWTTNGVSWVASASSALSSPALAAYGAFNNFAGSTGVYSWGSNLGYSASSPFACTSGVSTTIQDIGATVGEWLQIQTSVPLVMQSYSYTCGGAVNIPKKYWIVGSNDGSTWHRIQYADMTTSPFTANFQVASTYITVNQSGIQTIIGAQVGSGSFITYPTTTNAYTYFRIIATNVFGGGTLFELGEWLINFTAYTPALLQSLSMSPSGQYMALTGAGATTPNSTAAVAASWVANGVTWTSSISSQLGGTPYPYFPFQNTNGGNIWISLGNYSSGVYNNTYSTTVLGGIGTVNGEWLQIQSSVPLVITSYTFQVFNAGNLPKSYYIVGSSDGTTWYPIQSCLLATNPITSTNVKCSNDLLVNFNGTQTLIGNVSSTVTTTAYTSTTTNAYTYFRIIVTSLFSTGTNAEIGEWYINFQSGSTFYSTDYGSSWTRSLTAATIPNANVLATSGNGQYSLQASGQTVMIANNTSGGNPTGSYTTPTFSPALSSATGAVSNAAVSASGQYMVVLIQSTTNNVYYSSNYGVSFTGITLGSTAMVSCDISADGSYITVASATQVFTLNSNTQGLSITVGNQSGLTNQGLNSVAIGNQAGLVNQSANSIVLNSSGTAVNAYVPGFFVAPVASAGSSLSGSFAVLGYGTDNQVVQTGVSIRADGTFNPFNVNNTGTASFAGNVGFGTTAPVTLLHLYAPAASSWPFILNYSSGLQLVIGNGGVSNNITLDTYNTITGTRPPLCLNTSGGFVGIGMTNPAAPLHLSGSFSGTGLPVLGSYTSSSLVVAGAGSQYGLNIVGSQATGIINLQAQRFDGGTSSYSLNLNPLGGNVGIGITNPSIQLHVAGTIVNVNSAAYSYFAPNTGIAASPSGPGGFNSVIYAVGGIVSTASIACVVFSSFSDVRIKKNIESYPSNVLDLLLQFRVVSYDHIDFKNGHVKAGLIAQEVEQIAPSCVKQKKEYIPNIYSLGTHYIDGDNVIITVVDTNGVPKDVSDIEIGASRKIFLKVLKNGTTEHDINEEIITHTSAQFTVRKWSNYCADDTLFVYGTEIDDFRVLDKDVISMMGIKAIQELAKQNAALTQKLDTLLAWAQTQGFSG